MLRKKITLTLFGASLALGTSAFADHEGGGNLKVGLQYDAGLTYDDRGFLDTDANDKDPTSTTKLDLNVAKLTGSAEAAKDVNFKFQYNLLHEAGENGVEKAYAHYKHSDMLSFSVGRNKANQGGYEVKTAEYDSITPDNPYLHTMPFDKYADMMAVHVALAGTLTIQAVNDKVFSKEVDATGAVTSVENDGWKNDTNKNPALNIEWVGNFNGWEPLVQVGSYDLNKSMYFTLGVKGNAGGLGLWLDYTSDQRKVFRTGGGAVVEEEGADTLSAMNVKLDYALSGFTPWLEYHSFDRKQGDSDDLGVAEDAEFNAAGDMMFSDNGTSMSIGARCNAFGHGYEPYLAVITEQGKFDKGTGSAESLSNMKIKFGVVGAF